MRNGTLTLGAWQHIAATFDTATQAVAVYVNGVQVPTSYVPRRWWRRRCHQWAPSRGAGERLDPEEVEVRIRCPGFCRQYIIFSLRPRLSVEAHAYVTLSAPGLGISHVYRS